MQLSSSIIDNLDQNIGDVIKDNLSKSQQIQFAVGFLFLSGLKELLPGFQDLEKIQILIGQRTSQATAKALSDAFQTPHEIQQAKIQTQQNLGHDIGTEFQQTDEDKNFLEQLYEIVKAGKLEIKIYTKATLHAKAYIFTAKPGSLSKGRSIIGSSNLSQSGFYDNTELNVVVDGDENYLKMQNWFERLRAESHDFSAELLETIDQSWIKADPSPYEVYMKILYEMVGKYVENTNNLKYDWMQTLYQFQIDAVHQAVEIVKKYQGVFVSDVVGLGKTYTGSIILKILTQQHHSRGLVLAPAKLIKEWEKALRKFGVNAEVASIDGLKKIVQDKSYEKVKYVLVDESHKFKDPNTQRYPLLQEFIHKSNKSLIMLSATPLNLNGRDVYHQIKLFHRGEKTDLPISPNHLHQFFAKYENGEVELGSVLGELMVRRTRLHIQKYYQQDMQRMEKAFPQRVGPETIDYDLNHDYLGIYDEIESILGQRSDGLSTKHKIELLASMTPAELQQYQGKLHYAMYFKTNYIKEEYFKIDEKGKRRLEDPEFDNIQAVGENLKELAKITFYQRIESSPKAFLNTLSRVLRYNEIFLENLENGYIFKTKHSAELEEYAGIFDDYEEESEDFLDLDQASFDINKFKKEEYIQDIKEDIQLLQKLQKKAQELLELEDIKYKKLLETIKTHKDKKILIFSQYADTTNYLLENLSKEFGDKIISELSGNNKENIGNILGRFSPKSQDYTLSNEEKEIDILIATDMISEGQNLQDANMVINYDLHRNPVKLIQRIGRIDRIGSLNDQIYIYNFYPSNTGEGKLGLRSKVSERVNAIHKHIGEENKIISQQEQLNQKMIHLYETMLKEGIDTTDEMIALADEAQDIFVYSHLIKELLDCKNNFPEIYKKIRKMPLRMRTAQKGKEKAMAVYCKYGDFDHCYLMDQLGNIENNKAKFLKLVHADPQTPSAKLPKDHDLNTTQIETQFAKDIHQQYDTNTFSGEKKTSHDMTALKNKLLKYQSEYLDRYQIEEQDMLDDLINYISEGMETWEKRKFKIYKKIKEPSGFSFQIISEMHKVLEQIKDDSPTTSKPISKEKYIIISESIV